MRLHRAILSEISRFLDGCSLTDPPSIGTAELTDENPTDLNETEYPQWLIDRERASQYITWKQEFLDLMRLHLFEKGTEADRGVVLQLGTTSYYHAWEVACKAVLGDLLGYRLQKLPQITLTDGWAEHKNATPLQIIPRPIWARTEGMSNAEDVDTLIPDTATFDDYDGRKLFRIYDAKHYLPNRHGKMVGQPGVESATKQFLYQSAYQSFIEDHGFDAVVGAFLAPTEGNGSELLASVSFLGVISVSSGGVTKSNNHIYMWALPAREVFDCHLMGRELDEDMLGAILTRWEHGGDASVQLFGEAL